MYSHDVVDTAGVEIRPLEMNSEGELDGESEDDNDTQAMEID